MSENRNVYGGRKKIDIGMQNWCTNWCVNSLLIWWFPYMTTMLITSFATNSVLTQEFVSLSLLKKWRCMVDVGKFVLFVAGTSVKKRVEDVNPVATGHEREELEAELEVIFLFIILFWVRKFCFQKFGLVAQKMSILGRKC